MLVNNAGYALPKPFHETPMEDEEKFLRVLGISVVALTKLFIKDMIREKGKIMMISSVAAFTPPSSIQSLYGPVKTFINRFSEGLNFHIIRWNYFNCNMPWLYHNKFSHASGSERNRSCSFIYEKKASRIAEEAVVKTLKGKKFMYQL